MSFIKYRIHEVAKDFGMPTKAMMELFEKYFGKPKNHMQVLEENQLNLLFDVITQQNQVASLEEAVAAAPRTQAAPKEAPQPEAPKAAPAQQPAAKAPAGKPQQPAGHLLDLGL